MTNTNDFRRYSYQYDVSYAVDAFNRSRSSVAPKLDQPEKTRKRKGLSIAPNTKAKSKRQLIAEQKIGFRKAVAVFTVAALVMSMFFAVVFTYAKKNELTREISRLKTNIAVAQSENISLNAELEAMVSVSQIDAYAVEKLGMVKVDPSQIKYIDSKQYMAERNASSDNSQVAENSGE